MRNLIVLTSFAIATPLSAATYIVNVGPGTTFNPPSLMIAVGDTVKFASHGGLHNAKADDNSFRCANGCDGEGGNGAPASNIWFATHVFTEARTIGYYCETHGTATAGMRGSITVLPSTPVEIQAFRVD